MKKFVHNLKRNSKNFQVNYHEISNVVLRALLLIVLKTEVTIVESKPNILTSFGCSKVYIYIYFKLCLHTLYNYLNNIFISFFSFYFFFYYFFIDIFLLFRSFFIDSCVHFLSLPPSTFADLLPSRHRSTSPTRCPTPWQRSNLFFSSHMHTPTRQSINFGHHNNTLTRIFHTNTRCGTHHTRTHAPKNQSNLGIIITL